MQSLGHSHAEAEARHLQQLASYGYGSHAGPAGWGRGLASFGYGSHAGPAGWGRGLASYGYGSHAGPAGWGRGLASYGYGSHAGPAGWGRGLASYGYGSHAGPAGWVGGGGGGGPCLIWVRFPCRPSWVGAGPRNSTLRCHYIPPLFPSLLVSAHKDQLG